MTGPADPVEFNAHALFRFHPRLRPAAAARLSRGRSRERQGAGADHRHLPAALARARRPGHAPLARSVGRDFARSASRARRLPREIKDPAASSRPSQPQGAGKRRDRHGGHRGRRRRGGSPAHPRIHGRRIAADRRRRRCRRRAASFAARGNRNLRHRHRGRGNGGGDFLGDRRPRREAGHRGADLGRLRRELRRPCRPSFGAQFVCQRRNRRQH